MQGSHNRLVGACTPGAEHTIITSGRGTASSTPLGAIEVVRAPKQLDQVHPHIAVQVIVLGDDFLNIALQDSSNMR